MGIVSCLTPRARRKGAGYPAGPRTGAGLAKPGRVCAYPCRFGQTARGLRIPRRGTIIPRRGTDKPRGVSRRVGGGAGDSRRVTAVSGGFVEVSRGGGAVLRAKLAGPRRGAMETARGLRVPRRGTAGAERRNEVPRHGTMTLRAGLDGGGGGAAGPRHGTDVPPAEMAGAPSAFLAPAARLLAGQPDERLPRRLPGGPAGCHGAANRP